MRIHTSPWQIFLLSWCAFLWCPHMGIAQPIYQLQESTVTFVIRNAGIGVTGTFEESVVEMETDESSDESILLSGEVVVRSLDTGIGMRDRHLLRSAYFNEEEFPLLRMRSRQINIVNEVLWDCSFQIIIKGVEQTVSFPVAVLYEGENIELEGTFTIDRRDFNVGSNSLTLSDDVAITVHAVFRKVQ